MIYKRDEIPTFVLITGCDWRLMCLAQSCFSVSQLLKSLCKHDTLKSWRQLNTKHLSSYFIDALFFYFKIIYNQEWILEITLFGLLLKIETISFFKFITLDVLVVKMFIKLGANYRVEYGVGWKEAVYEKWKARFEPNSITARHGAASNVLQVTKQRHDNKPLSRQLQIFQWDFWWNKLI